MNENNIANNKHFWKTFKSLLSDKIKSSNNTFLVLRLMKLLKTMNNVHFIKIVSSLMQLNIRKHQSTVGLTKEMIVFYNQFGK